MLLYKVTPPRVNSLYRTRPAVATMVLQAILAAGGTVRHRWPAPCRGEFPRWTLSSAGHGR